MVKLLESEETLNATFQALADPTRRKILMQLVSGEATVLELAEPFQMSLPGISKHIKVLERAGLIERGKSAQFRPCRLKVEALAEANQWLEQYKQLWEERFDRLDQYLMELQQSKGKEKNV
ncbi:ArsR family transcriptional regulator [Leptospira biflexa]|jgi:DNA-binding transcriptional ArsR family regulator|uniref:Arsenical resistance operon repressor, transcriptional regulator, ArsR family n=1 Tax=Leptospira biflexa serovar Patoc (strain Patoc 1 / ATCC 23582 / Paris) TaxID=456481 RepID=B0SRB7_LEPBP|nr:metalloregulator ArsR/SmtB family transcription factor [Leptospira biflexa]ABZ95698.1 Transcriptional regulator, ArsR family [Leptospira biflexa serovar Patoc strain 'Patoc 1 (Ames)']ABZ99409.1 Arsenical resistance operon repressor, transcriptional regulator, ArsR family [Leptospira biflexa serovar Patoc strain 'Patoc 1 (Paris)']TGM37376.1 ArsR family transcriptional regulator [Leptospira biflexa]TGM40713.1 ArsR family transcriptional regulator [Leptospira biflexa]TGM46917.1 ArsR family tra